MTTSIRHTDRHGLWECARRDMASAVARIEALASAPGNEIHVLRKLDSVSCRLQALSSGLMDGVGRLRASIVEKAGATTEEDVAFAKDLSQRISCEAESSKDAPENFLPLTGLKESDRLDVVIPLYGNPLTGNFELRMTLRSIEENFKPLGRIWIVSESLPEGFRYLKHVRCGDPDRHNKDANIIDKLRAACREPGLSHTFMFWSDDQLLLKPLSVSSVYPVHRLGGVMDKGRTLWRLRLHNTGRMLKAMGVANPVHWDSHVPQPIDKDRFIELTGTVDYTSLPGCTVNTLYFNLLGMEPLVPKNAVKATLENARMRKRRAPKLVEGKTWLGFNDSGLSILQDWIAERFPNPSRFEIPGFAFPPLPEPPPHSPGVRKPSLDHAS